MEIGIADDGSRTRKDRQAAFGELIARAVPASLEGNPTHSSVSWVAVFKLSDGTLRTIGVWYPRVSTTPHVTQFRLETLAPSRPS